MDILLGILGLLAVNDLQTHIHGQRFEIELRAAGFSSSLFRVIRTYLADIFAHGIKIHLSS
jgi:hypothetical protein